VSKANNPFFIDLYVIDFIDPHLDGMIYFEVLQEAPWFSY
jgi:hypothetical protein